MTSAFVMPTPLYVRTRDAPGPVVLRPAVDQVRVTLVDIDVVELPDRKIVDEVPVARAVVREVQPAVVAEHHVLAHRSGRSRARDGPRGCGRRWCRSVNVFPPSIDLCMLRAQQPDAIRVRRIDANLASSTSAAGCAMPVAATCEPRSSDRKTPPLSTLDHRVDDVAAAMARSRSRCARDRPPAARSVSRSHVSPPSRERHRAAARYRRQRNRTPRRWR